MKRILFFGFAFLLLAPFLASAQTPAPYARYCPDPTQFFTDVSYDEANKPRIELTVDPLFEGKWQQERKLGNLPVTPVYDLALTVVPIINEYCLPQYDEDGTLIRKVDPPNVMSGNFTPYFALKNEILLNDIILKYYGRKTEAGERIYEWRVKGWPNGIFVFEKLEKVIKAVQENDPTLRIGVLVERPDRASEKVEKPISFELCVPLAGGNAPRVHKIVTMRGKSAELNVPTLVRAAAEEYRVSGFEDIQPFKDYSIPGKSWFAHFVDLSVHDDTGWAMFFGKFFVGANRRPKAISACGNDGSQYFFHTGRMKGNTSYAPYGGGIAFMAAHGGVKPSTIALHEMGHSFGWLEDEYHSGFDVTLYYANCAPASPIVSQSELARVFGSKSIQRNRIETLLRRAYWNPYGDTVSGCHTNGQYRPSTQSIMNTGDFDSGKFNVVSCGYLLRAITGEENLRPHWQECMKMDGLEKPAIIPADAALSLFSRSFAWLKNNLFAAVAVPVITDDTRTNIDPERFISVETFSPDGKEKQSEIFENTGTESNPSWRQVAVETEESAETVAKRYCPDPTKDFFKGSIYYENGKPWIEVIVDPEFEAKTLRGERKITGDIPLTPVYDLVVRVKPVFNYYCIPGWVGGAEVTAEQLPQAVSIDGFLTVGTNDEAILGPGAFVRTEEKDGQGRFVYEWKLKGWKSGITLVGTKMERLIKAVAKSEPVNILLDIPQSGGGTGKEKSSVSFDLCAPLYGGGEHQVVYMRGKSSATSFPVSALRVKIEDDIIYGFGEIEPFATYQNNFSHFFDLQPHDDSWYLRRMRILNLNDRIDNLLFPIPSQSVCKGGTIHLLHSAGDLRTARNQFEAIASPANGVVLLKASVPYRFTLHEIAHTFANLVDEYYQSEVMVDLPAYTNCTTDPSRDYTFAGKKFGLRDELVCAARFVAPGAVVGALIDVSKLQPVFRPSKISMMSNPPTGGFNIVSCGWILAAIKGGEAKSYFPECAKMDGVIKDGVTAQRIFEPIFAWFKNAIVPPESLTAQAAQFAAGQKVKVIVPKPPEPPVEFEAVAKGAKVEKPELCLEDASGQRVFEQDPAPFRARWEKEAKCAQTLANATLLQEKAADIAESIAVIETFINALESSVADTKSMLTLDNSSFSIIPAGERQEKVYTRVGGVSLQCVAGNAVPVGSASTNKGETYVSSSAELDKKLAAIKQKNTTTHQAYLKESAKKPGIVTNGTLNRLLDLQATLKSDFVLLSANALSKHFPSTTGHATTTAATTTLSLRSAGSAVSLSVMLEKDARGEKKVCDKTWPAATQLAANKLRGEDVGVFFLSAVTVDGKPYEKDCIPETYLLNELKTGIQKNLVHFRKLKAEYEAQRKQLESQSQSLANSAYQCGDATLVVQGGTPVRKSDVTPDERRAASAKQAEQPGQAGQDSRAQFAAGQKVKVIVPQPPEPPTTAFFGTSTPLFATTAATTTLSFATTTATSSPPALWRRIVDFFKRDDAATTTPVFVATSTPFRQATTTPFGFATTTSATGHATTTAATTASQFVPILRETPPYDGSAAASAEQGEQDGTTLQSSEPSYLIIESFDPNNPWGEIVEIVSDEEVVEELTRSDLVKLTLSVDGATDAVGVKKGEEAEVKWEGDNTIVSCRGSWNPTEKLSPSGSAKVVVNESSTFTVLCLQEDGSAVRASVIVSAVQHFLTTVRKFFAPSSSSGAAPATGPGFSPPSSYPIRTLVLDTLGNPVQVSSKDGVEWEGQMSELFGGKTIKSWKIKYEKKGGARFVCDPPIFNVSFDKKDKKGNKRELFTGISTYPGRPQLQYQRIRMVPLCEAEQYYDAGVGSYAGFRGKVNAHLREYFAFLTLRALGVPTVDVIGFANVSFVSPDSQYDNKTFRYMLLQRDNEQDDELPFTEQFNLEPTLIETGKYNAWVQNAGDYQSLLGDLLYTWAKDRVPVSDAPQKLVMHRDGENVLTTLLISALIQNTDRALLHNEDYGKVKNADLWKTIPYGFDWNLYQCHSSGILYFLRDAVVENQIRNLPSPAREEYIDLYARVAQKIFSNPSVLQTMHGVIERFPFQDDGGKQLLSAYVDVVFYRFGSYFGSREFADYAKVPHRPFSPLPFPSGEALVAAENAFNQQCNALPSRTETKARAEISSATLTLVSGEVAEKGGGGEGKYLRADFAVSLSAPNEQDISINKTGRAFLAVLKGPTTVHQLESPNLPGFWISYERPKEIPESVGPAWVIPSGKTARFAVAFRFDIPSDKALDDRPYTEGATPRMESGLHSASLTGIVLGNNANSLTPPENKTNEVLLQTSTPLLDADKQTLIEGYLRFMQNLIDDFSKKAATLRKNFAGISSVGLQKFNAAVDDIGSALERELLQVLENHKKEIADARSKETLNELSGILAEEALAVHTHALTRLSAAANASLQTSPFIRISRAAVSEIFQPRELPIGEVEQAFGSFDIFASEAAKLSPPMFRLSVTGDKEAARAVFSFKLWQLEPLMPIDKEGRISDDGERITFKRSFDLRQGTSTFTIVGNPTSRFSPGQRLTLSANFYKDDVEATSVADPKRRLSFPKSEVIINTLTAVRPVEVPRLPGLPNMPADVLRAPAQPSDGTANLSVTIPVITGSPAGNGKLYAGEMTLRATIQNEGGLIAQTFGNVWQYRDVKAGSAWTDWVKFEVAGLIAGGKADVTHTWGAGAGEWEFRLVADSSGAITESNEQDNYSEATPVSIVAHEGSVLPPPPSATGTPELRLATPVISGRQAGLGKIYAGSMTISEEVTNIGNGAAPRFQIQLFYSQNGREWNDWVRVDSERLAPGAERSVVYAWEGGAGEWYFKACEDIKDTCSQVAFVEVVPI